MQVFFFSEFSFRPALVFVRAHSGMKTDGDWWEQHVYSFDVESITKKKPDSLSVVLGRETYYDKMLPLRFGFQSGKTRRLWFTDLQQNRDQINIKLKVP